MGADPFEANNRAACTGAFCVMVLLSVTAFAQKEAVNASASEALDMRNCGLYCLYSGTQWYGMEISPEQIIRPEFLSQRKGATMTDLRHAAATVGLYATPLNNLRLSSLYATPYPIICSVRSAIQKEEFDHYVVVLPTKGGSPKVYDPLSGEWYNVSRLTEGFWNGHGVVLTPGETIIPLLFWKDYAMLALVIFIGMGVSFIRQRANQAGVQYPRRLNFGASLLVAMVLGVVLLGTIGNNPLFASEALITGVQARHIELFLDEMDYEDIKHAIMEKLFFVDARQKQDYSLGHIPGAVNIPPGSSPDIYIGALAKQSRDRPIIVYCQSGGCPYAVSAARELQKLGFENIGYYKAGWIDWEKHEYQG